MLIISAIFALVCLWQLKFKPANGEKYMTDYMSVDKTMAIKGIFILIVFFQHFNSYLKFTAPLDVVYVKAFNLIGQRMVTLFLLYSGYGVMESIKKKGMGYVNTIPKKRFLNVLFRFDIAILLFLIVNLIFKREFTIPQLLLSFTGWDAIGNSNWYIFMILVTYLLTFAAFKICKDKNNWQVAAFVTTFLTAAFVGVFFLTEIKDRYWYDTVILFPIGMLWSLYRDKFENIINKNIFVWLVSLGVVCAVELVAMKFDKYFAVHEIGMIMFAFAVLIFSMRISLNNLILRWCGKHLFGLYILQRIPFIVFKELGLADFNIYLYFFASLVLTIPMAWLFEKYVGKLWNYLNKPKNKKA